jgi:hypothetical protein
MHSARAFGSTGSSRCLKKRLAGAYFGSKTRDITVLLAHIH